jgi:hypothetical protein
MKHPYPTIAPVSRFAVGARVRITAAAWRELFGSGRDKRELVTGTLREIRHAGIVEVLWDGGSLKAYHEDHLEPAPDLAHTGSTSDCPVSGAGTTSSGRLADYDTLFSEALERSRKNKILRTVYGGDMNAFVRRMANS